MNPSSYPSSTLETQTERLEIRPKKSSLLMGVPKETCFEEKRIPLCPDAVQFLTSQGHRVCIEANAGLDSGYSDRDYAEAGGEICEDPKKVFGCPIVIKIEPPTHEEIDLMAPNATLISALQLKTRDKNYFEKLQGKKINAVGIDYIKDSQNRYPLISTLSQIAGVASIQIASEILASKSSQNGVLIGNIAGVPPTEIVIIGAGAVGESAVRTALGLGASVKVFDNSITRLQNLKDKLGNHLFTSTLQPKLLLKSLKRCQIAIGALKGVERCPIVVSEDMVQNMKTGALIIDVGIDQGGNFETSELTSHSNPVIEKFGVLHYGVPNIPSRYARTSSLAISNILSAYINQISEFGGLEEAFRRDQGLKNALYLYKGILTSQTVAHWFDMPYRDINLLLL